MILHFTNCKPHLPTMAAGGRTERCWLQLPEGSEAAWAWRWLGWKNGEAVVCRLYSLPSYPRENCAHSFLLRVQCGQTRPGRLPRTGKRLSSLLLSSQRPGDSEHAGEFGAISRDSWTVTKGQRAQWPPSWPPLPLPGILFFEISLLFVSVSASLSPPHLPHPPRFYLNCTKFSLHFTHISLNNKAWAPWKFSLLLKPKAKQKKKKMPRSLGYSHPHMTLYSSVII